MRAAFAALLLCALSPAARSQDAGQDTRNNDETVVTELDEVRVTAPRLEAFDPYRFRNPIEVESSTFARSWHETPSLEEIGKNGGVIPLLVGYLAQQAARGANKLPGWKAQIQPAIARPPPLDEAQMARAVRLAQDAPADVPEDPPPTP